MNTQNIGTWFLTKYRARQAQVGTFTTALQLKKQGVPLEVALAVLGRRS